MKNLITLLAVLCIAGAGNSCKTLSLATSDYNLSATGNAGVVGDDVIVVNTEKALNIALDTFDELLRLERHNQAAFATMSGGKAHAFCENIRRNGKRWIKSAEAAKDAYADNRNAQNHATLVTAYRTLQEAITQSKTYLSKGV